MKTSVLSVLNDKHKVSESNNPQYCTLQWRQNQLLVRSAGAIKQPYMPSLENYESLRECLQYSSAKLVRIDPSLGEEKVRLWADAAASASKPIYLRISAARRLIKPNSNLLWWLKRLSELVIANAVLVLLSPLMLFLAALMKIDSQAPLFERSWYVGERGKLFKLIKYNTSVNQETTQLRKWIVKYGLDNLPQLFNVIRGEMGLFGSRCWTLEDAVRLNPEAQKQLNNIPGIMTSWEAETDDSSLLHLDKQMS